MSKLLPALILLLTSCAATNEEVYAREKAAIAAAQERRAAELVKPPKVVGICATDSACCAYWCKDAIPCVSECDGLKRKVPEKKTEPVQTKPEEDT